MNTKTQISLPSVECLKETCLTYLKDEKNLLILDIATVDMTKVDTQEELLQYFSIIATRKLKDKFISPTIFEKDKKQIISVTYLPICQVFTMKVKDSISLQFDYNQICDLIDIGCANDPEDEPFTYMVDGEEKVAAQYGSFIIVK